MTNTALNRTTIVQLTNKSGSNLAQGSIVVIDRDNDNAFETTTTSGYTTTNVGVVFEPNGINNNATGGVALAGWVPTVLVSGTANRGFYLRTSPAAGEAYQFASAGAGDFGITLENGDSPEAFLFGNTTQSTGSSESATSDIAYAWADDNDIYHANTSAEQTVLNYSIDDTTLSNGVFYKIQLYGNLFNQSGFDQTYTIRVKSGTATAATKTFTIPSSTHIYTIILDLVAYSYNYSGSTLTWSFMGEEKILCRTDAGFTNAHNFLASIHNTANDNRPSSFQVSIQMGAADANLDFGVETILITGPYNTL